MPARAWSEAEVGDHLAASVIPLRLAVNGARGVLLKLPDHLPVVIAHGVSDTANVSQRFQLTQLTRPRDVLGRADGDASLRVFDLPANLGGHFGQSGGLRQRGARYLGDEHVRLERCAADPRSSTRSNAGDHWVDGTRGGGGAEPNAEPFHHVGRD